MGPADSLQFFEQYGVVLLPALTVAEQLGVPLPAVPALLAVGALAAHGRISIPLVLGAISVAALAIDFAWYEFGRRRGAKVLARLCKLSLEPDSCLRRAESIFARHAIGLITARASALGRMLGLVIVTALAGYILVKYGRRHLFLRKLRTASVSPQALKRRLDAGEDVTIIDLRTPLDVAATPYAIPGSRWLAADAIDEHEAEFLRSREVVLYCASPNDATSARMALQLKHKGITRVRPLEGGLAAWMALKFPVRTVRLPVVDADGRLDKVHSTAA